MNLKPFLSVVIPAYNETENFERGALDPVVKYLSSQKYSWEVLIVDDGSTDNSNKILTDFCKKHSGFRLLKIEHGGKSAAVKRGVLEAAGEIILFTDFDQSTPLAEADKFIAAHRNGIDVVIARRTKARKDTFMAKLRSYVFIKLVQLVALPNIHDSQCGFKSFKKAAAQKVFSELLVSNNHGRVSGGYMGAFDVEVLYLARKFGFRIEQIPVAWVRFESGRLNIWKEPLMMIRDTLRVRIYDILGKYD